MKLSTRIKKYVAPELLDRPIKILVDCGKNGHAIANSLDDADAYHRAALLMGCTLLPKECPVVNENEIVIHYTSTTYREWCAN